jgi:tRNA dimethylallyltransferase
VAAAAPPLIAIVGPTASGKSALGLRLAGECGGEIVSCDSLQVYRGFDVGSSKATPEERRQVPHHLLDVAAPGDDFSAADYARRARQAIAEIQGRGRLPLVVGGTGLYFRALFRGLFLGPPRDAALRARLERLAEHYGDARLHRLLRRVDPQAAGRIAVRDRVRVVRALEVYRATGRPISAHHRSAPEPLAGQDPLLLGLNPGRPQIRAALEARTREMFERGLLDEARGLLDRYGAGLRPLRAIGYKQAVEVVLGRSSPRDCERAIVEQSLKLAKRQMTWFRREPGIAWFSDPDEAFAAARDWLARRLTSLGQLRGNG